MKLHVPRRWRWLRIVEGSPSAPVATSPLTGSGDRRRAHASSARRHVGARRAADRALRGRARRPVVDRAARDRSVGRRHAHRPSRGRSRFAGRRCRHSSRSESEFASRRSGRRALLRAARLRARRRAADRALAVVRESREARRQAAGVGGPAPHDDRARHGRVRIFLRRPVRQQLDRRAIRGSGRSGCLACGRSSTPSRAAVRGHDIARRSRDRGCRRRDGCVPRCVRCGERGAAGRHGAGGDRHRSSAGRTAGC